MLLNLKCQRGKTMLPWGGYEQLVAVLEEGRGFKLKWQVVWVSCGKIECCSEHLCCHRSFLLTPTGNSALQVWKVCGFVILCSLWFLLATSAYSLCISNPHLLRCDSDLFCVWCSHFMWKRQRYDFYQSFQYDVSCYRLV